MQKAYLECDSKSSWIVLLDNDILVEPEHDIAGRTNDKMPIRATSQIMAAYKLSARACRTCLCNSVYMFMSTELNCAE